MSRAVRGCGLAAAAVVVAVVAFVAYAFHQLDSTLHDQPPPDVAKVADSAPVAAADQLAATRMDTDLAEVAAAGTGTALGPAAVLDLCQSLRGGMWVSVWTPVACSRTVTAYFAFNDDFERRMQSWSAGLEAKGWHGGGALGQPLEYYKTMAGKPRWPDAKATDPYLASDLPSSGQICKPSVTDASVCLRFDWAERPRTRTVYVSADGPNSQRAVRQRHDVDPVRTESADFAGARYVAIVSITDRYYDQSVKPAKTANPDPSYTPCYSGSHNCD